MNSYFKKLCLGLLFACALSATAKSKEFNLEDISGAQGTLTLVIKFNDKLQNGHNIHNKNFSLIKINGLCNLIAGCNNSQTWIKWTWEAKRKNSPREAIGMNLLLPEIDATKDINLTFTWDATKGIFDAYLDGYPARIPQTPLPPWKNTQALRYTAPSKGPVEIKEIKSYPSYTPPEKIAQLAPKGETNPFIKKDLHFSLEKILQKKGSLIYDGEKTDPQFKTWIKEGPLKSYYKNGWELFESTNPNNKGGNGHIVWWCPEKFPESFIAEWEVKIISKHGLCIVFFAAKGSKGESIFDEKLPKRDGIFTQYTKGRINSYHISYHTNATHNPGRPQVNLRKNNSFYLLAQGANGMPSDQKAHKVTLIKDNDRIIMGIDGVPVLDYTDNQTERFGAPYESGWFGLRQMSWTIGEYRNFKVWQLDKSLNSTKK